jgi:methylase of polypeptide subunit release factors
VTTNATDRSEALVERLFGATIGALELFSVYLGAELGLYRALDHKQDLNAHEVSALAGIHERYAREWLEQQAVAGLIEVDYAQADAATRRYRLREEYARVLGRDGDPAHVAPFAHMIAGIGAVIERVADAYRSGRGVPYELYGSAFRYGQGHINRPAFTHELPGDWLAAMPDVVARLEAAARPRIADVGCGQGWSTIALARAFPNAWVDGLDADPASVADGRRHAAQAGLDGRVRFIEADAAELAEHGPYQLEADPRGAARPGPSGRRPASRPLRPGRRRHAAGGRRARGRLLHRPRRRGGADDVRLERHALPAHPAGRAALGRAGHRPARQHRARTGRRGRLQPLRRPPRRQRLLPPLPAQP